MAQHLDNLDWLRERRDFHAAERDKFYASDDWANGNEHDALASRYYACIAEIERARERIAVFGEVLQRRIILALKGVDE